MGTQECAVPGGWGPWSDWSKCSAECGGGEQSKTRQCNNPAPANGGADCEGEGTEVRKCNTQACEHVYKITHTTGTGKYHGGRTSGAYFFTLVGENGSTEAHDCPADRSEGVTASCTFKDATDIGKLLKMTVENKSDNSWTYTQATVEIDGVVQGTWKGTKPIGDYETRTIVFQH